MPDAHSSADAVSAAIKVSYTNQYILEYVIQCIKCNVGGAHAAVCKYDVHCSSPYVCRQSISLRVKCQVV
jgi:hypothetical protein